MSAPLAIAAVAALAGIATLRPIRGQGLRAWWAPSPGSRALEDEGMVGQFWGSQGVGVLLTTGRHALLMLRSQDVLDPGVWGVPGGAVRVDSRTGAPEDLYQAAAKELLEETGIKLSPAYLKRNTLATTVYRPPESSFRFTTFVVRVPKELDVSLNWESDESAWVDEEGLQDLRLHHGVVFTLGKTASEVFHG